MKILTEKEFSIKVISNETEAELAESQVYIYENPVDLLLTGSVLEACVKYKSFYLAFMTNDTPYEEMLSIYMIDKDLQLIDSATIGSMYSTGSFHSLTLIEPNFVCFYFIGGTQWKIEIMMTKNNFIPFFSDPKGVSRKIKFSCYFKISGNPVSEGS